MSVSKYITALLLLGGLTGGSNAIARMPDGPLRTNCAECWCHASSELMGSCPLKDSEQLSHCQTIVSERIPLGSYCQTQESSIRGVSSTSLWGASFPITVLLDACTVKMTVEHCIRLRKPLPPSTLHRLNQRHDRERAVHAYAGRVKCIDGKFITAHGSKWSFTSKPVVNR